jgi:parvulin-like peptidyl-prolyl isomerase
MMLPTGFKVFAANTASRPAAVIVTAVSIGFVCATITFAQERVGDLVVVRVNDTEIRESDIRLADQEMGRNLPPNPETRRDEIISFLTDTIIFSKAAAERKVVDDAEVQRRIAFARNKVMMEQFFQAAANEAATESAVRKSYEELVAKVSREPEFRLYALQFGFSDPGSSAAVKAAEDKARTAYERIAKGEDFAAVARDMSEDPNVKANGGDRGYVTRAVMGKEHAEAALKLAKGQVSPPIKTQIGWHLIKVEDTRTPEPVKYEAIRDRLQKAIERQAQFDLHKKLRSEAKIERLDNLPAGIGGDLGK